jgi:long-subunit fatty acid transport protein
MQYLDERDQMKHFAIAAAALTAATGTATAGGLDRTYTPVDVLFEKGNYAELSFGFASPNLTGSDTLGNSIGNIADDFSVTGAAVKIDFDGPLSLALIYDQPYGADTLYGGNPAATMLGGTAAIAETEGFTALLRYQAGERLSFYGGPRFVKAEGNITLSGLAYAGASGYNVDFASDTGIGFVAGAAYEIPDIALRAALTYHSAVDISMNSVENIPVAAGGPGVPVATGPTNTETPQSIALDLQTGIATDTLLFGGVRWSEWSKFTLIPPGFGRNLASLSDTITYEIGVGRRFSDQLSGSIAITYEDGYSNLVSPLSPTNGKTAVSAGAKYQITDTVALSGGVSYTMFGDANPQTGGVSRGSFTNNDAISGGLKLGINF